jgi:hypothetical protein
MVQARNLLRMSNRPRLGDRTAGERSMRLGFRLGAGHGMAASPQAGSMRAIARVRGVELGDVRVPVVSCGAIFMPGDVRQSSIERRGA